MFFCCWLINCVSFVRIEIDFKHFSLRALKTLIRLLICIWNLYVCFWWVFLACKLLYKLFILPKYVCRIIMWLWVISNQRYRINKLQDIFHANCATRIIETKIIIASILLFCSVYNLALHRKCNICNKWKLYVGANGKDLGISYMAHCLKIRASICGFVWWHFVLAIWVSSASASCRQGVAFALLFKWHTWLASHWRDDLKLPKAIAYIDLETSRVYCMYGAVVIYIYIVSECIWTKYIKDEKWGWREGCKCGSGGWFGGCVQHCWIMRAVTHTRTPHICTHLAKHKSIYTADIRGWWWVSKECLM